MHGLNMRVLGWVNRVLGWLSLSMSLVLLVTSVVAAYRTHHGSADGGFAAVCVCSAATLFILSSRMRRRKS